MLILKLFAFDDRESGPRQDPSRAQAHACDISLITTLAQLSDYREGRNFLRRHGTSDVVRRARTVVGAKFSTMEQPGCRHVLASAGFYADLPIAQRRDRLEAARRRLARWFAP